MGSTVREEWWIKDKGGTNGGGADSDKMKGSSSSS